MKPQSPLVAAVLAVVSGILFALAKMHIPAIDGLDGLFEGIALLVAGSSQTGHMVEAVKRRASGGER